MGVVWRAYDELLDRTVAIKEVRYTGVGDAKRAELTRRTIREARAAGRLDHPSVVVIHDVVEEDGRPWIVMQLVRSRSLAQVIGDSGPLRASQVAVIGGRVLDALRAAHATGVLHRDVKPENVLLADDGRVVLTDFGIASMETEAGLTATGGLVGTPAYMPPERLNGEPARPESDLWSLGATLYAAVEGEPPFRRDSWAATVAAVLRDEPKPPVRAGALEPVIMGLLRRRPDARMPAEEAARLLYDAASEPSARDTAPYTGTLSTGPRPTVATRSRRGKGVWAVGAAAVAVLGAGGALFYNGWTTGVPVTTPTASGTPTATATSAAPSPEPTVTPTVTPSVKPTTARPIPAGWRTYTNADGRFSIAVPERWQVKKTAGRDSVSMRGPGSPGTMLVEWTVPDIPWRDPVKHWEGLEREIEAKGEFERYTRIGIGSVRYLGQAAADWEFTRVREGVLIHVINRSFHTADGRPYALYWETTHDRWERDRRYVDTFIKTFRPK
ncbi:Serine/threonine protein kinase [Nonomuraea solani]|uniref:non-specific serine/threonine protein kinase n=2 Tax=Nonomuraea solani TaxID=1144553 RepID=A0A1H6DEE8_9ACTN|nr:Serine/threonine protein kinase [Nonomuraea solani]